MIQYIINKLYREPKGYLRSINRQGGFLNARAIEKARKEMEAAAALIKIPFIENSEAPLEVCFLTGKKYWYQTIFCIKSLVVSSQRNFIFHIYDDGSLDDAFVAQMKRQVPGIKVHLKKEIDSRLQEAIPPEQFPFLWHKRKVYPHIKKLTDIHAGQQGWKLVLDSDMLFFKYPTVMLEWLQSPSQPFYILDATNSYGYSAELMNMLAGGIVPEKVNVGAIGLNSESLDWESLERWGATLETREGTCYYLEQALSAMLISNQTVTIGAREEYIVMPSQTQVERGEGVLHHYVDLSKEWYFKTAWKAFV